MSKLRTFLQQERGARGWTKTDLAGFSGVPLSTLSRYESVRHTGRPSHENVLRLARAFRKEPRDILQFIGYPRRVHNPEDRDAEWSRVRDQLDADPRARRILELYGDATDEDRDIGVELLETYFSRRLHRRHS